MKFGYCNAIKKRVGPFGPILIGVSLHGASGGTSKHTGLQAAGVTFTGVDLEGFDNPWHGGVT